MNEHIRPNDFEPPFCDYAELYIWNSVRAHLKIQHARRSGQLFSRKNTTIALLKNPYSVDENGVSTVYWQDFLHPSGICTTGVYAGYIVKPGAGRRSHELATLGRPMLSYGGQWDSDTALADIKLMRIDQSFRQRVVDLLHEPHKQRMQLFLCCV